MRKKKQYEAIYAGYVYDKPSTYWTATDEVKRSLMEIDLNCPSEINKGGMPIISEGEKAYIDADDGHTAIIACSGMKKSICGFLPLVYVLANANENMILTDPKGEIYSRTSGFLKSIGYNILCLDFRTMDKDCFNILGHAASVYRNENKNKGLSLLSDIINVLAEKQRQCAKDPFWPDTGALWMNGTGAIMLDAFPKIEQVNVLNWSDFNVKDSASIVEEYLLSQMPENTVKAALKQCLSSADNTFKSIIATASSFLAMFNQNPMLADMLSHSSFTMEDLLKSKTVLFLVTDDTTSTADPILGMIINQIQSFLIDKAYHSKNGKLDLRINFILDEFASIPIPNMDKALATHRSRNIRYYICVQSLALLKERYENPEKLLSNCASLIYFGSTELELLKELETKLGTTRITPNGSEKPLCSQAELMTLKKSWNYKEVIYMNLSKEIRYCTEFPSIEKYNISGHQIKFHNNAIPKTEIYSVEEFVSDVFNRRIRAPFVVEEKRGTRKEKKNKRAQKNKISGTVLSDAEIEEQFMHKFDELFGEDD